MLNFFPTQHEKSVFALDYAKLFALGFRGLIFDIDATLVPHGQKITPEVIDLFSHIHALGFKTLLLSNNGETRIGEFNHAINTHFIANANKPNPDNYLKALTILNLPSHEVVMIGDQLFTDILGANRSGIRSILVDFLPQMGETKLGKKRAVEKMLMFFYRFLPRANALGDIVK